MEVTDLERRLLIEELHELLLSSWVSDVYGPLLLNFIVRIGESRRKREQRRNGEDNRIEELQKQRGGGKGRTPDRCGTSLFKF